MNRAILLLAAIAACGGKNKNDSHVPADEKTESSAAAFELPFEKYQLDNGLTVIIHQDKSDPIVAMATIVHVGSSREKPGRTGFAHFFEHMSFNNSENVPMGANRKMIPELGGSRNGGTWSDGTIYYEVVPKDAFEKLMWIDSDRFGYMINTVKQGTLEREKQVVKNEKRQRVDNRPYGHTGHVIRKALYPVGHPYNWTVIGDLEDLQSATLADVREFYDRYYTPANATLVIAGDLDIARTKELVQKWFGEIKAGVPAADMSPMPVTLTEAKKLYHVDNFAKVAELRVTFPTVEQYHADSYALSALGSILADGKSAPLYKRIVVGKEQSSSVNAYQSSDELAGTFTISVRANPGIDLDDVYKSIHAAFGSFEGEGFRDTDLERIKAGAERAFYNSIESILDKALQLGIYNEFAGDPAFIVEERKRHAAVSREDVMRVYNKYIKDKPAIITSFVPKAQPTLIVDGSTVAPVVEEKIVAGAEKKFKEDESESFARTPSKHDRSEPPLGPRPTARTPSTWKHATTNGMRLYGIEQRELPLVNFHLRFDAGQVNDAADKIGTASLVAELLNEGTRNKTPLELEDAIDLLGASIQITAGRTSIDVSGQTLARNYDATMKLVSEMLLEPRWDAAEFKRLKIARLAAIEQQLGNPPRVAANAFFRQIYGAKHVGGQPFAGSAQTVEAITLDDVKGWYDINFSTGNLAVHVVGAVGQGDVVKSLGQLDAGLSHLGLAKHGYSVAKMKKKPAVYFIDVPGAKQSVIYVGRQSIEGADPRFYLFTVVNNRLGAGSSARLTQKLRIEKGYSYGAYSTFTRTPYNGAFFATSQVRSNVTLESLQIFKDLIGNYASTFTEADLATTKNLIGKGDTRRFETLGQLGRVLSTMSRYDLPDDYIARQSAELAGLTLPKARELIDSEIILHDMTFVVVGDARTQLGNVEKLGYGKPVLLDRLGAVIQ